MRNKIEIHGYFDDIQKLFNIIIQYLDTSTNDDNCFFEEINNFLDDNMILSNHNKFKEVLHLLSHISNNYHRSVDFWDKIDSILTKIQNEISSQFANYDIFNIFSANKRALLFLLKNKILIPDNIIAKKIMQNEYKKMNYPQYFYPEFKTFYDQDLNEEINKLITDDLSTFELKRELGENDIYLCSLIRNDSVIDFISYVNRLNLSLNKTKIKTSIYETNPYLINNTPTLIEYSAFFGSIQIFRYLLQNNVELSSTLWIYAIHSNNPELIHLLEENNVKIECFSNLFIESIKCNHIDFANYFNNQKNENYPKKYRDLILKYYCFPLFPSRFNAFDFRFFYNLCKYDYPSIVDSILKNHSEFKVVSKNRNYKSTFGISINKGNNEIVKRLMTKPEIDINSNFLNKIYCYEKGDHYWSILKRNYGSSLCHALYNNNIDLRNFLLSQSNINLNGKLYTQINLFNIEDDKIKIESNALLLAIENDDLELARYLINREDVDINAKHKIQEIKNNKIIKLSENTVLNFAINKKNLEIIQLLLSRKDIDINAISIIKGYLTTSLVFAMEKNNEKIVELLLKRENIDINAISIINGINTTALILAIEKNNEKIVELLLQRDDIDINKKFFIEQDHEITALCSAIEKNNEKIVELLLQRDDIDINKPLLISKYVEITALNIAIEKNNDKIILLLLQREEIKETLSFDSNLLLKAIDNNNHNIVKLLLARKEIIIKPEKSLYRSFFHDDKNLIQLLLTKKDIKNALLNNLHDILIVTINDNRNNVINFLLSQEYIVLNDIIFLSNAIKKNNKNLIELLLSREDINILISDPDQNAVDLLFAAYDSDNLNIFKYLVFDKKININRRRKTCYSSINSKEETILNYAIMKNNVKIVQLLLSREDINVNIPNISKSGIKCPLYIAIINQNLKIVQLLLSKKEIDINIISTIKIYDSDPIYDKSKFMHFPYEDIIIEECTPLHTAIINKQLQIIELLLDRKDININAKSQKIKSKYIQYYRCFKYHETLDETTPLHDAIAHKLYKIIKLLLAKKELDVNEKYIQKSIKYFMNEDNKHFQNRDLEKSIEKTALHFAILENDLNSLQLLLKRTDLDLNAKIIMKKNSLYKFRQEYDIYELLACKFNIENRKYAQNFYNYGDKFSILIDDHSSFLKKYFKYLPNLEKFSTSGEIENFRDEYINHGTSLRFTKYDQLALKKINEEICLKRSPNVEFKKILYNDSELNEIKTPLFIAVEVGNPELVQLLLTRNEIDVNFESQLQASKKLRIKQLHQDNISKEEYLKNEQKTALFLSFEKENIDIIKLLFSFHSIDVNIKSSGTLGCNYESHPFQLDELKESISTDLTEQMNDSIDSMKKYEKINQKTILFMCVEKQNVQLINLLLSNPCINIKNRNEFKKNFDLFDLDRYEDIIHNFEKFEESLIDEKENNILKLYFLCNTFKFC